MVMLLYLVTTDKRITFQQTLLDVKNEWERKREIHTSASFDINLSAFPSAFSFFSFFILQQRIFRSHWRKTLCGCVRIRLENVHDRIFTKHFIGKTTGFSFKVEALQERDAFLLIRTHNHYFDKNSWFKKYTKRTKK